MTPRYLILTASLIAVCASAAAAEAPVRSPRPDLRPGGAEQVAMTTVVAVVARAQGLAVSPFPVPRPVVVQRAAARAVKPEVAAESPEKVVLASAASRVQTSPRPNKRPRNLLDRFLTRTGGVRAQPATPVAKGKVGSVCGDPAIRGQVMSSIPGKLRGCGVENPVRVTAVDGVTLSQPAKINCTTAKALRKWVSGTVKPAVGRLGGGVSSLQVFAHYSCRTRNNQRGAKISEHGRGKAIDIGAINLKNGASLTVLKGWHDKVQGPILRKIHGNACGTFGTVLGPRADRFHQDHFHLDTASHRGGSYCR